MNEQEKYMQRCLELAKKGFGNVAPNPMVGSVIVYNNEIIGEGYHMQYGQAHAEVNAINSVKDKSLLKKATLYVNLEPCSHFGKTPPCADLIIEHKIPYVVIGTIDSFAQVCGRGIEKLTKAGIDVKVGVLEEQCKELNKRFFIFQEKKRPYIILKWAQTADGFIDAIREDANTPPLKISNDAANKLVHTWRSQEQAIMVGKNTALLDNPQLTVRNVEGKSPIRIVTDKHLSIPATYYLLDKSVPTIIFTGIEMPSSTNLEYVTIDFDIEIIPQILNELYKRNIQSLIIEGGYNVLHSFIADNCWDEARVFISEESINNGINAPEINRKPAFKEVIDNNALLIYVNN
ncbi:MAG: bifunctional diaminohydroxyphosphoribosylaminopyrimidine deaminase/5-amino-6-(5-phosphoribosylamino)uracil reductase RibD [Bacteroidetes bacterium]|nr:bifunctional diaminohydroxyphosphoribosylaminopyrimidine deaminase/5-amino-6-(5-phosphoribosylamino)uracil reductase RibD [Bacteroidota bacterium]